MAGPKRKFEQTIEAVVKQRLPGVAIEAVESVPALDHDGDPVIWVTVIYDPEVKKPPVDRMLGMARHIQSALKGKYSDSFPILSYMSKADAEARDRRPV
jgi:hypothetical protein